jgi:nicotinamidase-related amidase
MTKRIILDQCCGVIIDVQEFFLAQLPKRHRAAVETNTRNFATLLGYLRIPIVVTIERPLDDKGTLPPRIGRRLGRAAATFEKDFFDLTQEKSIRDHLRRLKKKQAIVAGCETDVCVLQSCLGLIGLGFDVFVVEELIFSGARNVASALTRMKDEGAVFVTYKTLYYELFQTVDGNQRTSVDKLGPYPDDLPDTAVE